MKKLCPFILHILITTFIISDHWYGIEELGNIALAFTWVVIIIGLNSAFTDPTGANRKIKFSPNQTYGIRVLLLINVLLMFAVGWFITASFLLIAWLISWGVKLNALAEAKKKQIANRIEILHK